MICFQLAMRPNCSAIAAEEKVGCVLPDPKKPNGTVCLALHCCWNPAETNNLLKCFTKRYVFTQLEFYAKLASVVIAIQYILYVNTIKIKPVACGVCYKN